MAKGNSKVGKGKSTMAATNARDIDNMNAAQLEKEIAKTQRAIERAENTMNKNDITNTADAKAMREAFPLGVGGDGWTEEKIRARDKGLERDAVKAKNFTEAYSEKESAQARLKALEKAQQTVKGTDKTTNQIKEEKLKKAVESAPKTMKWTTTQKGGWKNGGYMPKIIKSGDYEIHGSDGLYTIFKKGQRVGSVNKLSTAKAYAERNNK